MKDWLHGALKILDHERGKLVGLAVGVLIIASIVGCDVKVRSPFTGESVTRDEFTMEVMTARDDLDLERLGLEQAQFAFNKKIKLHNEQKRIGEEAFVEKEKFQQGFIEIAAGAVTTLATGGQLNMAQILMSVMALGGVGTAIGGVVDSARKNKVINNHKNNTAY
jgi:hypothetical protein